MGAAALHPAPPSTQGLGLPCYQGHRLGNELLGFATHCSCHVLLSVVQAFFLCLETWTGSFVWDFYNWGFPVFMGINRINLLCPDICMVWFGMVWLWPCLNILSNVGTLTDYLVWPHPSPLNTVRIEWFMQGTRSSLLFTKAIYFLAPLSFIS